MYYNSDYSTYYEVVIIFECDNAKLAMRLKFLQHMMKSIGMDILTEDLIVKIQALMQKLYAEENKTNE